MPGAAVWVVDPSAQQWARRTDWPAMAWDGFVLGQTKPDATSVGYIPGTTFTTISGNQTYATDGVTVKNTRFTGMVKVTAKNVTFQNCWFTPVGSVTGAIWAPGDNVQNLVCERCTFQPAVADSLANSASACVFGHDFTLLRCDLSGAVDGIDIYHATTGGTLNANVYGCWLHDLAYWSPDSSHTDNQTHSDLIQIHYGGTGVHVLGCRMDGTINPSLGNASDPSVDDSNGNHISGNKLYPALVSMSVIMASPVSTTAGLTNFIFEQNWSDGGVVMINWPRTDGVNIQVINNRWGHTTYLGDTYTILAQAGQVMTITGNYYEDTGVAYNGRKNG